MYDIIEKLDCETILQHGENNNRVYLMQKGSISSYELAENLIKKSELNKYSKVIAKVKTSDLSQYIDIGYEIEGYISKYYPSGDDLFFTVYYLDETRRIEKDIELLSSVYTQAKKKKSLGHIPTDINGSIKKCKESDIHEMISVYKEVFPSYPFPIFEEDYIFSTMNDNVNYYCIKVDDRIVALSSAEIDYKAKSAEMTDFATLQAFQSNGYASRLLNFMESDVSQTGITTFYTIARACSYGMNITFSKSGYLFGGRLKNNTNISGKIESMNIWYKDRSRT